MIDVSNKWGALECLKEWRFNTLGIKTFLLSSIVIYIMISLPTMLGIGYVIDWMPEATELQKFKGYVMEGLTNNYVIKIVISIIIGAISSFFIQNRNFKLD